MRVDVVYRLKGIEGAARSLGIQPQLQEARGPGELDSAFAGMTRARAGALLVVADPLVAAHRTRIADLAMKARGCRRCMADESMSRPGALWPMRPTTSIYGGAASSTWTSSVRNMEQAGVPRLVAMKLTGHRTEHIYRRYAMVSPADLKAAVDRLDRYGAADNRARALETHSVSS